MTPLLAFFLACSSSPPLAEPPLAATPPLPAPVTAPAPPEPAPPPPPAPEEPEVSGPVEPFAPLPGWLAFAASDEAGRAWAPGGPAGKVVLLQPQGFDGVAPGTVFDLVQGQALGTATFESVAEVPVGCDGNSAPAAVFSVTDPPGPGPVWLLPQGAAPEARDLQLAARPQKSPTSRAWRAGALVVSIDKTADRQGDLAVKLGNVEVYARAFDKPTMDGAENGPLDLWADQEVGLPIPVAAWRLVGDQRALVLQTPSYEGIAHTVLMVTDTEAREVGTLGTYLCAF